MRKSKRQKTVETIKIEIAKLKNRLQGIQESCPHHPWMVEGKYGYHEAGYDYPESQWTDCRCRECDFEWREDGRRKLFTSKKEWEAIHKAIALLPTKIDLTSHHKNHTVYW